jgi:MFS family permease
MPDDSKKIESLRFSFIDGVFASGMMGFTQDYFAPFLLLLGATAKQIGALSAFPNLFAALAQLKSADITERLRSRKRVINTFIFLQAVMLLPMAIMAFTGIEKPHIFIAFVVLFTVLGAVTIPAWSSLMSDLVTQAKRGSYFGWRNRVLGFILVGATFVAGFILNVMKNVNIFWGFSIIFGLAFVFRLISWYFLTRMYEPPLTYKQEHYFNFLDFISRLKESNFAKFVLFVSLMSFSVNLAAPFFSVLMLEDLHFSYLVYTLITISATMTIYLMIKRWGNHADKIGNIKIIKFTSPLIAIIPLLWLINRHPLYLFLVQMFAGFLWAGFNLCASNFIYDAVIPEKRTRCIAYFNTLNGLAICCGALLGGFLLQKLPPLLGHKILMLFLISSLVRLVVGIYGPLRIKEVRPVDKIRSSELFFSVTGIRPILGVDRKPIRYEDNI